MTNIREELAQKLNQLSTEQLYSVCQFVDFLEYKQQPVRAETPLTNNDTLPKVVNHLKEEQGISHRMRQPGSAIGTIKILADDDEHLEDFRDYMP
ncbi:Protein of unknown function (DUF2281) [Xenococcus sp. PCC 7305]|uniref:DUF2281 domain-containing protein n=1 Tax=Xenococcus sp. PCC 7305 TaxID=102125 RepID=UPI0002ABE6E2|nr:DUF2281 domain-containing protein [Xenococcus sp. PCC 7305]ELS04602.1 Protein of unknown function (DUF2281) [Xenococcus sp. PCC 7305]